MKSRVLLFVLWALSGIYGISSALGEPYTVFSDQKIADGIGGIPNGTFDAFDFFGGASAALGDLDGDGVTDVAVAASGDDSANGTQTGSETGAVHILFLNANGTVKSRTTIADGFGGVPNGTLSDSDFFGFSCSGPGDLDGDQIPDLVVGAPGDDTVNGGSGGNDNGAVYILFLNADGTVKGRQKIADGVGGVSNGTLANGDRFGSSAAVFGDLDGDGVTELAVGAYQDDMSTAGAEVTTVPFTYSFSMPTAP
jgi:hypothetical protein